MHKLQTLSGALCCSLQPSPGAGSAAATASPSKTGLQASWRGLWGRCLVPSTPAPSQKRDGNGSRLICVFKTNVLRNPSRGCW